MSFQLIVVGTSFGGLHALQILLKDLPKSFPVPIAVVIHRHKASDGAILTNLLQDYSQLLIKETQDKEDIIPGCVYLAPANYHLLVEGSRTAPKHYFALSTDDPVTYARPSIDVLFETAANVYAENVIGVLLTGANHDGSHGLAKIKAYGGKTVVEEPSTAVCGIMPQAAIIAGVADRILPLEDIPDFLVKICNF
ncbi:chemotaxis protein CheB [Aetokthonos hydrillicola Thurmond2011]|jgi:two-component system chemotaxis response regulator CheB|uniref:protein-glutamate methylesterase n=1 Tax=Aetokthonos hydrillicola Thurmond2011 TaxID=2712845 RepID=A0AAP5I8K9_9CYAN|nr:chemotaxis protein CheB [Aetokthonos hydrillicola]MBO3464060.1 chemotaxis protein CheB [Aetokthonos hydrillicola CCALA 1050]MBW4588533.1 chemotaxis protein CheB [Aetokthonos hydrillicola CCALA 1050]MDR9896861.1 chemotaxis protein CheB [Aetokthonos hydrillicola Thurmond2011]